MKAWHWILLLAVLAAGWLFLLNGFQSVQQIALGTGMAAAPAASLPASVQMISYNDPTFNFTVSYPVGYAAALGGDLGAYLRFASMSETGGIEVIDVLIDDTAGAKEVFDQQKGDKNVTNAFEAQLNGRKVYFVYADSQDPFSGDALKVKAAFLDCANYTAGIVMTVHDELEPDLAVFNAVVESFEC